MESIWHLCRAWGHSEAAGHKRWVLDQQMSGVGGLTLAPLESAPKAPDALLPPMGYQSRLVTSALVPGTVPG